MVDDARREEMKRYQQARSAARRDRGLVSRTIWIREADLDAFRAAVSVFSDHARLIEAVTGCAPLSAIEIAEIVKRHSLPYDPEDLIFLTRVPEALSLRPGESGSIRERAEAIIARYALPVTYEDLQT